jgi:hypothetical protein
MISYSSHRFADIPRGTFRPDVADVVEWMREGWVDPDFAMHTIYRPSGIFEEDDR